MSYIGGYSPANKMRLTGLATGMDTDETVKGMTKADQLRIDKEEQAKQIVQWRQELYREIIKDCRGFYDKYFEVGSKDSIFNSSNYATTKITSSNKSILEASSLPGAKSGTYKVEVEQKAENSKILGRGLNVGHKISGAVNWNGKNIVINNKTINIDQDCSSAAQKIDFINNKINTDPSLVDLKGKVQAVKVNDGTDDYIRFDALTDEEVKINSTTVGELSNLQGRVINPSKTTTLENLGITDASSFSFQIQYTDANGNAKTSQDITISKDDTIQDFINKIYNTKSNEASETQQTYLSKDIEISFSELTRSLTFNTRNTGVNQTLDIKNIDFKDNNDVSLGTAPSKGKYIKDIFGIGGSEINYAGTGISGSEGKDAIAKITPPGGREVTVVKHTNNFDIDGIKYDIKAAKPGEQVELNITSDVDDAYDKIKNFIDDYNEIVANVYTKIEEKTQRSYKPLTEEQKKGMEKEEIEKWESKAKEGLLKNDVQLKNMIYKLRSSFFKPVEGSGVNITDIGLNTSKDTTKRGQIVIDEDKLKEALKTRGDQVESLLTGSTSTYRASIVDETTGNFEIDNWKGKEIKFKIGSDVETITIPSDITESNIGDKINEAINANSKLKGKISVDIDTSIFKEITFKALTDEAVEITDTNLSITDKNKLTGMNILNKEANSGIFTRMKDIFRSNVKTFDGPLLKKAGWKGTVSENSNTYTKSIKEKEKKIKELQQKMFKRQDYYYKMFARLETYMNQMNAQQGMLMQQLGMS